METGSAPFREGKTAHETRQTKTCMHCGERRPASEFRRRTGRRASSGARRGACRRCRQLGVREQHNRDMRVAQASPSAKLERRGQDGMDSDLREDMVSSLVKNERERNERIALQGSAAGKEQGRDLGKHVNSHAEAGAVLIDQMEKDVAIVSVSDTPSQRKKRRRRRKKKPSEVIHAHASVQAESESEASTDLYAVDRRLPGGELPPGDVHSPGVAAANGKGSAQRARKRAAAVVPAAEQASAAQALLPATPQGPAAGPAPVAADEPPAARRKRKRRSRPAQDRPAAELLRPMRRSLALPVTRPARARLLRRRRHSQPPPGASHRMPAAVTGLAWMADRGVITRRRQRLTRKIRLRSGPTVRAWCACAAKRTKDAAGIRKWIWNLPLHW